MFRWTDNTAAALYLAAAAVLFLWAPLGPLPAGHVLAGGDIATQFIPWLNFIFDSLRQFGELPLWNPYLYAGAPLAANSQAMLFYPFTYLGLLLPLAHAMVVTIAIHIWLAGMGMYGWLRSLGATHAGALLAGLAFAFTGTLTLRLGVGQYGMALQLAWWPWSFWMLQLALERRAGHWAILAGVPLAMALLTGNASMVPLLYIALGAYGVYCIWGMADRVSRWRAIARAAIACAMSLALAAVQYLPLFTLAQLSTRASDASVDFSARFAVPVGHLIALVIPNFFGEAIQMGNWSVEGHQEITYYVGLLIFCTALIGLRLRQRLPMFFLALALGAVILELGPPGVFFTLFYRWVPGWAWIRGPGRAGLIYTFAVITAAGLVWSELERADHARRQHLVGIFSPTAIGLISNLTGAAILLAFILYATFKETSPAWPWHMGGQLSWFLVLFWACMGLLAAWKNGALAPRTVHALAALILLLDLWAYGLKGIRFVPDPIPPAWARVAEFMQGRSDYRIAPEDFDFFMLNGALSYRLRSHYGYDPLVLAGYDKLLQSAPDYWDRVFDLLNIQFVLARNPLPFAETGPRLDLVLDTAGLKIYQRPAALPRAFIVHEAQVVDDAAALTALHAVDFSISRTVTLPAAPPCPLAPATEAESAQIVSESPNHLELDTQSHSSGLLVLSEVYYPGWQASVDGQAVPVLRADTALRAVCLPAGSHTVRFDFRPLDLVMGAIISGVAWCLVSGTVIHAMLLKRRMALETSNSIH